MRGLKRLVGEDEFFGGCGGGGTSTAYSQSTNPDTMVAGMAALRNELMKMPVEHPVPPTVVVSTVPLTPGMV